MILLIFLSMVFNRCSDDGHVGLDMTRPVTPEYVVGRVTNENVNFNFQFSETIPVEPNQTVAGWSNCRIVRAEDTTTYVLTVVYDPDPLKRTDNYFTLLFTWNENTGVLQEATLRFAHSLNGVNYRIYYAEDPGTYPPEVTIMHRSAQVDLHIARFNRDAKKKQLSFDFIIHIQPERSNLTLETNIAGSIMVNYQDFP